MATDTPGDAGDQTPETQPWSPADPVADELTGGDPETVGAAAAFGAGDATDLFDDDTAGAGSAPAASDPALSQRPPAGGDGPDTVADELTGGDPEAVGAAAAFAAGDASDLLDEVADDPATAT